jgi:hypothetical protein
MDFDFATFEQEKLKLGQDSEEEDRLSSHRSLTDIFYDGEPEKLHELRKLQEQKSPLMEDCNTIVEDEQENDLSA